MLSLYVLAAATATILSIVGCVPAALVLASVGVLIAFGVELRAGLRKVRRPARERRAARQAAYEAHL